jgi:2-polyprenyl-6-methoxyphenol hydroxylase-like FAD-dependent oxidoreductase
MIEKALVVGGGIGGLAAAIALRNAGIDVDLVEIKRDFKVYHVGIMLQGNCLRAIRALGVLDATIKAGFPQAGLTFQDLRGNVIADIPGMNLLGEGYPSDVGVVRPALHEVLLAGAQSRGARLRHGVTWQSIRQSDDAVNVHFTDGGSAKYDVVIGADGAYSSLRGEILGFNQQPQFTGQGVWRYNVPRPSHITRMVMCIGLVGGKCGFVPATDETGYVLLVQSEPGNPKHPAGELANIFRQRLAACEGEMARLRDQITDPALVVYRPLEVCFVPRPWHNGRVLLIGDAVHATTPHLAQGAAQAIEDAVVAGETFSRDAPIETLMQEFTDRRHDRCRFIYESSIQIGEWEQRPTPAADPDGLTRRMREVVAAPI